MNEKSFGGGETKKEMLLVHCTLLDITGAPLGISTDGFKILRDFQQNFTEFRINFLKAQQQLI